MSLTHPGPDSPPVALDPNRPRIAAVTVSGDLHDAAAARVLRWCEAHLHLRDLGGVAADHLIIDVGYARHATGQALAILDHARAEAGRRGVGIHLVGADAMAAASPPVVGLALARWNTFTDLDTARAAVTAAHAREVGEGTRRPTDPDAIALTGTDHDWI